MAAYESLNYMDFDSLLNEEELMIRNTVREFVSEEVIPTLQEANRKEEFPSQLISRFGEMGLLGVNIHGYDCPGLGEVAYGLVTQELERGDSGIRSFCSVQGALVMYPILTFGSEEQKQKYLPRLAKGEIIGCFGLTEPDAGSNPGGMLTKAEKVSGGYKLNGNKMWITNGCVSDIAIVWAKLDGVVRGFIVETKTPGFSTTKMKGKFALRVSVTSELHMEDCVVPEDAILPNVEGLKGALMCLTQARYGIAWGVLGAANACYHEALNYSRERIIFDGKPLASYQLAQAKLVKMAQEITKGQLLVLQLGRLKEKGEMQHWQVSMAKMNNCRMALDVARDARDMLGANGTIDEYPVIRHMMNLETVNTYEGTEDIHRLVVGQQITGHSAIR
ncbi:MAG: acyl-CoA dehydrogenase family protein [Bdellovibrionaceae bacterium]|nr:acyl-CoA dehydrogenase family protein [Bdellovibrionales bacterium]MCB9084440.1 acyl-CoA dehydrogenase family protein [Pseudobdellovibrionaceae bacterium]